MDCTRAIRAYVDRILKPKDKAAEVLGMKALLLDRETVRKWIVIHILNKILPGFRALGLVRPCFRAVRRIAL